MFLKCFLLLFVLVEIESFQPSSCVSPRIQNGRVRLRNRSKMAKFSCMFGFTLVGNKYATCLDGQWDVAIPVCVKPGCPTSQFYYTYGDPSRPMVMLQHYDAVAHFFCHPKHVLVGSETIHCDGRRWNATVPICVPVSEEAPLSCDFEHADICGWTQDEFHDFDWRRHNMRTPSAFLSTGPSHDHTYGERGNGYYMYIESTSRLENDTARLMSPLYDSALTKNGCFEFYYHMFGKTTGGLRVYQKPATMALQLLLNSGLYIEKYLRFEKWGNQGDAWYTGVINLVDEDSDFQIVIEGIRGTSYTSDIAIDDVAIMQGDKCREAFETATTPVPTVLDSCLGRCDLPGASPQPAGLCGCSASCVDGPNCCADFLDLCVFGQVFDDTTPAELPQTEKLIGHTATVNTPRIFIPTLAPPPVTLPQKLTPPNTHTPSPHISPLPTTFRPAYTNPTTPKKPVTSITVPPFTVPAKKSSTVPTLIFKSTPKYENMTGLLGKNTTIKVLVTTKMPSTTTVKRTQSTPSDRMKAEKEQRIEHDKLVSPDKKSESSGSKTTVTVVLCVVMLAAAAAAAVWGRGERGRAALAKMRGRARHDPDVRYLNSAEDDD